MNEQGTMLYMIKSFKHKGLEDFYYHNSKKGINPDHTTKLKRILAILNTSKTIQNLKAYPNFKFDEYKIEVYDIDYIDYH